MLYPQLFTWFPSWVTPVGLAIIMLGMGLTLEWPDFRRVLLRPRSVLAGVFLQFVVMPGMGWSMAELFDLGPELAAGLILVCCCPGGTASNVIAYLARADVALSVTMTALSTMGAVILTPVLTTFLVGERVEVDTWGLLFMTATVVLIPVVVGLILRRYCHRVTAKLLPFAPAAAVLMILVIVGKIIGEKRDDLLSEGLRLTAAVFCAHAAGFGLGYSCGRVLGLGGNVARTISIEVGMQNSGLGAALARANFTPLVSVPSAISAVIHCVIGSAVAAVWSRRPPAQS